MRFVILFLCVSGVLWSQGNQSPQTTPNLNLFLPQFNAPNWDVPLNANFVLLDQYLSGNKPIPALTVIGTVTASSISGLTSSSVIGALGFTPLNPANNLNDVSNKTAALSNLGAQPAGSYLTGLSGDVIASGPRTANATLATVNSSPGTCGDSGHVCAITTDQKGRVTAQTPIAISGGGGGGGAIFYSQSFNNATSVAINHNLNSLNVFPTVYDSTGRIIGYTDFTIVDANNATLTFATPVTGSVRIMTSSAGIFAQSFNNATSLAINHNLNSTQLFAIVFNTSNVQIGYTDLTPTDANNATLTFATPTSGRIVLMNP
jgi:hypothetical protein